MKFNRLVVLSMLCASSMVAFAQTAVKSVADEMFRFDIWHIGIYGNTHFLMQDLNNAELADLLDTWLQGSFQ